MRVVVSDRFYGDVIASAAPEGIAVSVVTVPLTSLHHFLTHAVAEGNAPDLALLDSIWIAEFAGSGWLVASSRFDGRTFGVSAFGSVAGIWYRRGALAERGLEPPRTWDELRAVALRLSPSLPGPMADRRALSAR